MSLPTHAVFIDNDGTKLAYGFCNIGWSITEEALPKCVDDAITNAMKGPTKYGKGFVWDYDWQDKWTYVTLYGYKLSRRFLTNSYATRMAAEGKTIKDSRP